MEGQPTPPIEKIRLYGVLLLTMLPVLAACLLTSRTPVGAAVSGEVARPPLAFAQYAVNLREVNAAPLIDARFEFWNRGENPVTILELKPSCGCLAPRLERDKDTFDPGERGSFTVIVRTANETPGPKDYNILVRYDSDGKEYAQYLTFRLTIPELKLSLEPQQLVFYELGRYPEPQKIYVADYRGTPIQVLDATTPSDLFTVTILDREIDSKGQIRVPILVEVTGEIPPGRRMERMSITTSDPEFGILQVPLTVFGRPGKERMANGSPAASGVVPASAQSVVPDAPRPTQPSQEEP